MSDPVLQISPFRSSTVMSLGIMIDSTVPVDRSVVVGTAAAIPEALPESGRKPRSFFLPLQSQSYKEMDAQKLFRFSLGFYGIKKNSYPPIYRSTGFFVVFLPKRKSLARVHFEFDLELQTKESKILLSRCQPSPKTLVMMCF